MNMVDMSLDDIAKKQGVKPRRGRGGGGRRGRRGGERTPVTNTQQRRKSIEQHTERAQKHRNDRRSRRQDSDKAQYVPVVFGNGTPEKVLTGRLTDSQVAKVTKESKKEPVSLVQAALARGREVYLKSQAKNRPKEQGGKRAAAAPREQRKRPVIPHPLSRKLHIVRPGDPGYQRQLRQLRNKTYSVRLIHSPQTPKQQQQKVRQQQQQARRGQQQKQQQPEPARRLMGPQGRRIALGASKSTGTAANDGPLSKHFSSLKK